MDESQSQAAPAPKSKPEMEAAAKNNKPSFWKRRPVVVIGTCLLALLFIWGFGKLAASFSHESTDDAFLAADIVSIAPKVSGEVKEVYVKDNQVVKAGDPLLQIDPRDYDTALAQKKAAQSASDANTKVIESSLKMLTVQIATAKETARQSEAQAAADKANALKASEDLKRAQDLIERKIIAPQEFDTAQANAVAATNTWKASEAKAASDRSKIDEAEAQLEAGASALDRAVAQARQSAVDVKLSDLNLSYTKIVAPASGRITRKAVEPGDYVQIGQRLMAVVPTNIWVVANFKETQLQKIRVGQPAEIYVDSVGGRAFAGRVQSIQAGSGAAFSLLPPENAVGNFVKVVQRVPVKIVFDNPIDAGHVLGPGMSVVPSVQVGKAIPEGLVMIVAIIAALGIGFLWWRTAAKPSAA